MRNPPRLLWLPLSLGIIWFVSWAWISANSWSGEHLSSPEYRLYFISREPFSWNKEHPECRNRFAFWPDGTPIEPKFLNENKYSEFSRGNTDRYIDPQQRSPEELAKDNWARDVRKKIAACEEAEWMPIIKAQEIKAHRIGLITAAFLPPILLLVGAGLMIRAPNNLMIIAGKTITSIGAFAVAAFIGTLISLVGPVFNNFVLGRETIYIPNILRGARLDVLCALLIPSGIALWSRQPVSEFYRVRACCMGIAAAFLPIVVQIISWPLVVLSTDGVWAASVVAVFATIILSISVTRHALIIVSHDASLASIVPRHTRRGLLRLYATLAVPWAIIFGYLAYQANSALKHSYDESRNIGTNLSVLDDPSSSSKAKQYAADALRLKRDVWEARTNDDLMEKIFNNTDVQRDHLTNTIYLLLGGFIPPLLYPIVLWLIAGFRKSPPNATKRSHAPRSPSLTN